MRQQRAWRRLSAVAQAAATDVNPEFAESEQAAADLTRSSFRKELHTTIFYAAVGVMALVASFASSGEWTLPFLLVLVPVAITFRYGPRFLAEAHLAE